MGRLFRSVAPVAVVGALGLFAWHVAWLTDCRNYNKNGGLISYFYFQRSACPSYGPYGRSDDVALYALLAPVSSALKPTDDLSGSWKIETRGGPVPECALTQQSDRVIGSCGGPQASGRVSGTVVGEKVRLQWHWLAFRGRHYAGTWDFAGTLADHGHIVGTATGGDRSLKFAAAKQG